LESYGTLDIIVRNDTFKELEEIPESQPNHKSNSLPLTLALANCAEIN
jgi:hypothetical protein